MKEIPFIISVIIKLSFNNFVARDNIATINAVTSGSGKLFFYNLNWMCVDFKAMEILKKINKMNNFICSCILSNARLK